MRRNNFIPNILTSLFDRFGVDITVMYINSHSTNLSTGVITQTKSSISVRGLYFASNMAYHISSFLNTNEFPSGNSILNGNSFVVLKSINIDFEVNYLIIENKRYEIVTKKTYPAYKAIVLEVKEITGKPNDNIINIGVNEYIEIGETISD